MGERLRVELKQNKPFGSKAEEALLNVERTADCFRRELQHMLKPFGITSTQYNALRILRGALPEGLTCSELGQRLVSSDPDITRLLDRLARQGLASRRRGCGDKRIVLTKISDDGLALLERVIPVIDAGVQRIAAHMSEQQLTELIDLLEIARLPLVQPVDRSPEDREAASGHGGGSSGCEVA
jgi:DNA-binding MarR family transcriptional regulator